MARIDFTGTNATTFAPTNTINTTYAAIGCQTCHEPHGNTTPTDENPHLIRTINPVTFGDGTVITNAGEGQLCIECHHSRDGGASNNVAFYVLGSNTWVGGSSFGPHDGVQGDMIEGVNAITYGQTIPSSAHRETVTNLCVGCHMQSVVPGDPAFLLAGGHTFEMTYSVVSGGVTNVMDKTTVCTQCHGPMTTFNFPVEDYANLGSVQGVQTEVQALLNQLSALLPNTNGVLDGLVKSVPSSPPKTWTTAQLQAAYNYQFVNNDGSLGVHNAPFATGILKASIADLGGGQPYYGMPNAWELQYFGSLTNANGAPNASPAGDGIPNWLKYALGINPTNVGISVPNGVVWDNSSGVLGGSTNTIQIYTAAEISFNTVSNTTYQIQEISNLGGGWVNVGEPILATNNSSMSYLTPTRSPSGGPILQQYFRVMHTP
jgi:cytochrome c553